MNHEPVLERHLQAIGREGNQDMRVETMARPVVDGPNSEFALEGLEYSFKLSQLDVEGPWQGRIPRLAFGFHSIAPSNQVLVRS